MASVFEITKFKDRLIQSRQDSSLKRSRPISRRNRIRRLTFHPDSFEGGPFVETSVFQGEYVYRAFVGTGEKHFKTRFPRTIRKYLDFNKHLSSPSPLRYKPNYSSSIPGTQVGIIVREVNTVESSGVGSSPEFDELISGFGVEDAYQSSLYRRRRHHRPLIIHRQICQLALMRLREGREEQFDLTIEADKQWPMYLSPFYCLRLSNEGHYAQGCIKSSIPPAPLSFSSPIRVGRKIRGKERERRCKLYSSLHVLFILRPE